MKRQSHEPRNAGSTLDWKRQEVILNCNDEFVVEMHRFAALVDAAIRNSHRVMINFSVLYKTTKVLGVI